MESTTISSLAVNNSLEGKHHQNIWAWHTYKKFWEIMEYRNIVEKHYWRYIKYRSKCAAGSV